MFFQSDQAGNYKGKEMLLGLTKLKERTSVSVKEYNYSEAQDGKDMCDRNIGPNKKRARNYIASGHHIRTPNELKEGLQYLGGIQNNVVNVYGIEYNQNDDGSLVTNFSLSGNVFSPLYKKHQFVYNDDGSILVRNYSNMGEGQLISKNEIENCIGEWDESWDALKYDKEDELIICPEEKRYKPKKTKKMAQTIPAEEQIEASENFRSTECSAATETEKRLIIKDIDNKRQSLLSMEERLAQLSQEKFINPDRVEEQALKLDQTRKTILMIREYILYQQTKLDTIRTESIGHFYDDDLNPLVEPPKLRYSCTKLFCTCEFDSQDSLIKHELLGQHVYKTLENEICDALIDYENDMSNRSQFPYQIPH